MVNPSNDKSALNSCLNTLADCMRVLLGDNTSPLVGFGGTAVIARYT
jgi:hypothetical protein